MDEDLLRALQLLACIVGRTRRAIVVCLRWLAAVFLEMCGQLLVCTDKLADTW